MDIIAIQEGVKEFTTPDHEFPFHAVQNINITNIKGEQVLLSSLYDGTTDATKISADWRTINFSRLLHDYGVKFYVILPVPLWSLQKYANQENLSDEVRSYLYCDPTSETFQALGFNLKFDSRNKFTSIHAKTTVFEATWKGFVLGVTGGGMQGDPRQQGGCFILSKDKTLWCHYDRHNADQVPLPILFQAGNIAQDVWKFSGHSIAEGYTKDGE